MDFFRKVAEENKMKMIEGLKNLQTVKKKVSADASTREN